MATGDSIQYDDFVNPEALPRLIEDVNRLIDALALAEKEMGKIAIASKGAFLGNQPQTLAEVEALKKEVAELQKLIASLEKTKAVRKELTIETAKSQLALKEHNAEIKNTAQYLSAAEGSYDSLNAKQKQLTLEYNKADSTLRAQLAPALAKANAELKAMDATVGKHQRSVGDYTGGIIKAAKATGGLAGLIDILGKAFGMNEEVLQILKATHSSLIMGARDLSHAMHGVNEATEAGTVATEANIAVTEEDTVAIEAETVAKEASNIAWLASPLGIMAAVAVGIAAIGVAIYEFTKSEEDSAEAMHLFNEQMTEQQKLINSTDDKIRELAIAHKVANGEITKADGERYKVNYETNLAIQKEMDQHEAFIFNLRKTYREKLDAYLLKGVHGGIISEDEVLKMKKEQDDKFAIEELRYQTLISKLKTEGALANTKISDDAVKADEKIINKKEKTKKDRKGVGDEDVDIRREREKAPELIEIHQTINNKLLDEDIKYLDKKQKLIDDARKKEIEQTISLADDLIKIENEYEKKKLDNNLAVIDAKLDQNKTALDVQLQLAAAGYDNNLAYELKKQDQLDKEKQKELAKQKKIAKEEEELALGLSFIKAFEKNLDAKMSPPKAAAEALAETYAVKAISKTISGSALDGTEDTGNAGGKGLDGKGGMLWLVHSNERIFTKEQNKKVAGLSNEEVINAAFDSIYKPQLNAGTVLSDISLKSQVENALVNDVVSKVGELIETIKNKPEQHSSIDNLGNVTKTFVENGIKKSFTKQTYLS